LQIAVHHDHGLAPSLFHPGRDRRQTESL
jgi:hypothetical protein